MIDIQAVKIESIDFSATDSREIYENLLILYTTPEGSVPFDRQFGLNFDSLDEPTQIAQGRLIIEYTEKTQRYAPRASVKEVIFDVDEINGKLIPRVVIERVE